jgi:hypothetical protein
MWYCSSALRSCFGISVTLAPSDSNAWFVGASSVTSSRPEMPTATCPIAAASVVSPALLSPSMMQLSVGWMVSKAVFVWTLL